MKYVKLKGSRRTAEEQSYIWATMRMWHALPEEQRQQVRSLVEDIALTPVEGRALYDVMVRGLTPHSVAERVGMPVKRLYSMRREFIDRYAI